MQMKGKTNCEMGIAMSHGVAIEPTVKNVFFIRFSSVYSAPLW